MATRKAMRAALRAAVPGTTGLEGFTVVRQWGQNVDAEALPGVGFFTPREIKGRAAARMFTRETDIVALIRMQGGDTLEDDLDDAAALVEALGLTALTALLADGEDVEVVSIDTDIPGQAEKRIGGISVAFRVLQLTSDPG